MLFAGGGGEGGGEGFQCAIKVMCNSYFLRNPQKSGGWWVYTIFPQITQNTNHGPISLTGTEILQALYFFTF